MQNADLGKLILRLCLGLLLLFHGIHKLQYGIGGIEGMLMAHGLPGFIAYGVLIGEVLAPLMVLIGYYSRIGAGIIVINMLVAVVLVHIPSGDLFKLAGSGGWALELQAFYLFTALALCFMGAGRYAVKG